MHVMKRTIVKCCITLSLKTSTLVFVDHLTLQNGQITWDPAFIPNVRFQFGILFVVIPNISKAFYDPMYPYTMFSLNFRQGRDYYGTTNREAMPFSIFIQWHSIQSVHHGGFSWSTLVCIRPRILYYQFWLLQLPIR